MRFSTFASELHVSLVVTGRWFFRWTSVGLVFLIIASLIVVNLAPPHLSSFRQMVRARVIIETACALATIWSIWILRFEKPVFLPIKARKHGRFVLRISRKDHPELSGIDGWRQALPLWWGITWRGGLVWIVTIVLATLFGLSALVVALALPIIFLSNWIGVWGMIFHPLGKTVVLIHKESANG